MLHARIREARISAQSGHEGSPQTPGPVSPHMGPALKGQMSTSVHDFGFSKGLTGMWTPQAASGDPCQKAAWTYQAQTASTKHCMPERGCLHTQQEAFVQTGHRKLVKIGKRLIMTRAWNEMERNGMASSSSCSCGRDSRTAIIRGVELPLAIHAAAPTA